jgi:hypothetical protein
MSKFVSAILIATALLISVYKDSSSVIAGTCASKCGPRPIQFSPGQRIQLKVLNKTPNLVNLQKPSTTNPITLRPGQELQLNQGDGTEPNVSLLFWNEAGLPLKATVSKPNFATLQVELRPTWYPPGDRAIYILDDGRVDVL